MNTNPILNSPIVGYAHHRIILDEAGKPFDYEFIEVNNTFEKLTGLKSAAIIGKSVRQIIPGIENADFDWISYYGDIALNGGEKEFEQFSEQLNRWYRVHVYSEMAMEFTTVFVDITSSKRDTDELKEKNILLEQQYEEYMQLNEVLRNANYELELAKDLAEKNEARYHSITKASNTGAWEYNNDQSKLWCSEEYFRMLGRKSKDFPDLANVWNDLLHPDDRQSAIDKFTNYLNNGSHGIYENYFRMQHSDGSWVWIWSRGQTLHNSDGTLSDITVGTHINITEQKHAEAEMRKNEDFRKRVFENSRIPIVIMEIESLRFVDCNQAAVDIYQLSSKADAIGKTPLDVSAATQYDGSSSAMKAQYYIDKTIADGSLVFEWQHQKPNGDFWDAEVHLLSFNYDGKTMLQFSVVDITERKESERTLRQSRKEYQELSTLLRLMADNVPDMLWAKNLKKEYIFANKAICTNLLNAKDTQEPIGKTDLYFANRERNSHPDNPEWHTFGEICRDSDVLTLEAMQHSQFDEYGNVLGNFLFLDVHKAPLFNDEGKLIGIVGSGRDVTTAKEAENQLRKLSQAVEQSSAIVIITDTDWIIEYVNPKFTEVTGYTPAEMIGKQPIILGSGEQPQEHFEELCSIVASGNEWRGEFHNRRKNGETYWESAAISPIKDAKGQITHYLAIKEDITEQKAIQEHIRITRDTYSNILNSISEAIYVIDDAGIFIDVNRGAEIMYGCDKSEIIGKHAFSVSADGYNDLGKAGEIMNTVALTGKSLGMEFWAKRSNGEVFPKDVIANKGTYFGEDCLIVTARDISERKKFEAELSYHANLRELLMEISSGFINIPIEQVSDTIQHALAKMAFFVEADRSYIFDYEWDAGFARNTYEWTAPGIRPEIDNLQDLPLAVLKFMIEKHKDDEPEFIPDVSLLPDGAGKSIRQSQGVKSFLTVPMMNDGVCIGFVGFDFVNRFHDYSIDEMQLLKLFAQMLVSLKLREGIMEQLVSAKKQAEESDRLKTAFLQNMSHEIRTPLNGILGFSKILCDEELSQDEIKEYTGIIAQSGNRLMETIGNVLDISKIDTGQVQVANKEFSLNSIMDEKYSLFATAAKINNIALNYHLDAEYSNTLIISDEMKLSQILSNLINNALKFTKSGSIDFGCSVKGDEIEFYVQDTGIGIAEKFHHRIFSRFAQVDLSITRGYEGAGLGLAICRGLVELLGGRIWFESELGVGTTFYFTIPHVAAKQAIDDDILFEELMPKPSRVRILVAEDDLITTKYIMRMMEKENYNATYATNGKEAVELCRSENFDLVLMDIKMPILDGLTAAKAIKQFKPNLAIVAQSAFSTKYEIERYLEVFDDYITKPFLAKDIMRMIDKYAGNTSA